jgi:hypothetical protein
MRSMGDLDDSGQGYKESRRSDTSASPTSHSNLSNKMLSLALSFGLLATLAAASPVSVNLIDKRENGSPFVSPSNLNLTYSSKYNR